MGAGAEPLAPLDAPTEANTDKRRFASDPHAHCAGSEASLIGRRSSKAVSHVVQRNS
jgi:hypothetical protein